MGKRALILVDIQNDYFPNGKWVLEGVEQAADNAARLLAAARAAGETVVHIRHEFASEQAPFFVPGSEGARIHPKVLPQDGEAVVLKQQVNAFRDTPLQAQLQEQGIEALTIVGNMSHMCIDAITRAAADLGYPVTVIHDACATLDLEFNGVKVPAAQAHAAAMAALAFAYAQVVDTEQYLQG
ncbi:cysteine hydrolase [Pseudomonas sp. ABC1]|uniref:cysteine hydrolase family protein n=1 Tax=Pseudomonas sp. ABC1 TaxID=2748080 RepID=UPI0015C3D021|nr:cysteine hydrolase family protein [Pseudomonas sp. ABC1]QLF91710.1 cysteine hydrolase [Pseudomonas sp. ABC1]